VFATPSVVRLVRELAPNTDCWSAVGSDMLMWPFVKRIFGYRRLSQWWALNSIFHYFAIPITAQEDLGKTTNTGSILKHDSFCFSAALQCKEGPLALVRTYLWLLLDVGWQWVCCFLYVRAGANTTSTSVILRVRIMSMKYKFWRTLRSKVTATSIWGWSPLWVINSFLQHV
jgi:hypothetical protein